MTQAIKYNIKKHLSTLSSNPGYREVNQVGRAIFHELSGKSGFTSAKAGVLVARFTHATSKRSLEVTLADLAEFAKNNSIQVDM